MPHKFNAVRRGEIPKQKQRVTDGRVAAADTSLDALNRDAACRLTAKYFAPIYFNKP